MTQEERHPRLIELVRVRAKWKVDRFRCWKVASSMEHPRRGVDLDRSLKQQVLDSWVKVIADH